MKLVDGRVECHALKKQTECEVLLPPPLLQCNTSAPFLRAFTRSLFRLGCCGGRELLRVDVVVFCAFLLRTGTLWAAACYDGVTK